MLKITLYVFLSLLLAVTTTLYGYNHGYNDGYFTGVADNSIGKTTLIDVCLSTPDCAKHLGK